MTTAPTPTEPSDADLEIWRLRDIRRVLPLSPSRIYKMAETGHFPKSFKLSERASGWSAKEVRAWIADRMASRSVAV